MKPPEIQRVCHKCCGRFTGDGIHCEKCRAIINLEVAMKLFSEQAATISKSGSRVSIQCDNGDEANAVFDWLSNIGGDMKSKSIPKESE